MQYEEFRSQLTIDPKGRLTLPVQLREELSAAGVDRLVGIAAQGSLWLFTPDDYRTIIKGRVRGQDPFSTKTALYLRAVVSTNQTLPIDSAGRGASGRSGHCSVSMARGMAGKRVTVPGAARPRATAASTAGARSGGGA